MLDFLKILAMDNWRIVNEIGLIHLVYSVSNCVPTFTSNSVIWSLFATKIEMLFSELESVLLLRKKGEESEFFCKKVKAAQSSTTHLLMRDSIPIFELKFSLTNDH